MPWRGGTPEHAAITANVARLLGNALEHEPCRVFSPDLRVRVAATGLATYPDVTVICGKRARPRGPQAEYRAQPAAHRGSAESSTEDYDRGERLGSYEQIPTLREVMWVAHDRQEVEVVRREADGSWSRHIARANEAVRLAALDCELPVAGIYRNPLTLG